MNPFTTKQSPARSDVPIAQLIEDDPPGPMGLFNQFAEKPDLIIEVGGYNCYSEEYHCSAGMVAAGSPVLCELIPSILDADACQESAAPALRRIHLKYDHPLFLCPVVEAFHHPGENTSFFGCSEMLPFAVLVKKYDCIESVRSTSDQMFVDILTDLKKKRGERFRYTNLLSAAYIFKNQKAWDEIATEMMFCWETAQHQNTIGNDQVSSEIMQRLEETQARIRHRLVTQIRTMFIEMTPHAHIDPTTGENCRYPDAVRKSRVDQLRAVKLDKWNKTEENFPGSLFQIVHNLRGAPWAIDRNPFGGGPCNECRRVQVENLSDG